MKELTELSTKNRRVYEGIIKEKIVVSRIIIGKGKCKGYPITTLSYFRNGKLQFKMGDFDTQEGLESGELIYFN